MKITFFKKAVKSIVGGMSHLASAKETPTMVSDYRRCTPMHRQYPAAALKGCLRRASTEEDEVEDSDEAVEMDASASEEKEKESEWEEMTDEEKEDKEWEWVEDRCPSPKKVARFAEKKSYEVARFYKQKEVGPNGEEWEEPTKQRRRIKWSVSRRHDALERLFQAAEEDVKREMEMAAVREREVVSDEIIDPWKAMLEQWKQGGGGAVWKMQGQA